MITEFEIAIVEKRQIQRVLSTLKQASPNEVCDWLHAQASTHASNFIDTI